jgi:tellurite resistance protein TerC
VALARRRLPFTDRYDGGRLVTRVDGRRVFTPLALVLIAIGSTDVLFALVLLFIGAKLVLHYLHDLDDSFPEVSTGLSLVVIVGVLAITTLASLRHDRN